MKALSRKERLVENEVIFRDVNKNMQKFIKEEPTISSADPVPFYCECAKPDCLERINLTPAEYEKLHQNKRHFVTLARHEFPEVEKIVSKKSGYQVVEKYIKPPRAEDIDLALKSINNATSAV